MNPEGRGRVENSVEDASFLQQAGIAGIPALLGPTEWGDHSKSVLVGSLDDYQKFFGGYDSPDEFGALVTRMLRRGAPVRVARLIKRDINGAVDEEKAECLITVTGQGGTFPVWEGDVQLNPSNIYKIYKDGIKIFEADLSALPNTTPLEVITSLTGLFNAYQGEFELVDQGSPTARFTTTVETSAYNTSEFAINDVTLNNSTQGDTPIAGFSLEMKAAWVGAWGAKIKLAITDTEDSAYVEVKATIDGYPAMTRSVVVERSGGHEAIRLAIEYIEFVDMNGQLSEVESYFTYAGTPAVYGVADYKGDSTVGTGIHVFDEDTDFIRIAAPMIAIPEFDAYLADYAETRKDCRAWLRAPIGVTGRTAIDYRKGTGVYSHSAIDTWYASMVFGDLNMTETQEGFSRDFVIPALTDVLANASLKDGKTFNWIATAGADRGRIPNNNGVVYNLGVASRALEADLVDKAGLNMVIKDADFGTVYWGNGTLQFAKTLLSHENIAELLIYLSRVINPIAKSKVFDPNDPVTWRSIYKRVDAIMTYVRDNRGVYEYEYQGDQLVTDVTQVTVNTNAGLDAGLYKFRLFIKPTPAMKYVEILTTVTNSGASFELL